LMVNVRADGTDAIGGKEGGGWHKMEVSRVYHEECVAINLGGVGNPCLPTRKKHS